MFDTKLKQIYKIKGDRMSSKNILKLIKDKQVEYVDLRFTDPKGKLQHLTMDCNCSRRRYVG